MHCGQILPMAIWGLETDVTAVTLILPTSVQSLSITEGSLTLMVI